MTTQQIENRIAALQSRGDRQGYLEDELCNELDHLLETQAQARIGLHFSRNGNIYSASLKRTNDSEIRIDRAASYLCARGERVRVSMGSLIVGTDHNGDPIREKAIHLRYGSAIRNPNRSVDTPTLHIFNGTLCGFVE